MPKLLNYRKHHTSINSTTSLNPPSDIKIYPNFSIADAPYQFLEAELQSAIFLPKTFGFGHDGKIPVLLIPGTGSMGGETFAPNFAKLLSRSTFADPCWLNIPGKMCVDATKNAEFVAYAINYLSSICDAKISLVGWSQGTLSAQWALKYWPSTRTRVRNLVCLSGVFGGTVLAKFVAPRNACGYAAPAIWQQRRGSKLTKHLKEYGGGSAYVPTTSVYSAKDEVVQPQSGERASARLRDERCVGVLNCEIQSVVGRKPASLMYTHFSMLNPLAWALTEDAIIHGDCGSLDRIDMKRVCSHTKPAGLTVRDVAKTKALAAKCAKAIVTFEGKCKEEPALPEYCRDEADSGVVDEIWEDGGSCVELEDNTLRSELQLKADALLVDIPSCVAVQETTPEVWGEDLVKDLVATQKEVEQELEQEHEHEHEYNHNVDWL
ncbi:hypothetical protein VTL71DRAFT_3595 [Oculimacula yallundae]|uniref:Uncharacterized protein n=1 Tax=Oculimacula yallundae TaxID=86028 RepID=A0ABR4C7L8_9HELO